MLLKWRQNVKAAVISAQGARKEMEDFHFLETDFGRKGWVYAGVYDGHGGKHAASYAARRVHELFLENLLSGLKPQKAFVEAYVATSEELNHQDSGTTAVDLLIMDGRVYIANAGDARAIVVSGGSVRQLSLDHRVDVFAERQRIIKAGGLVCPPYTRRGFQGIIPTRTLGDEYFKPVGIIATPSVREYEIKEDDLISVVASDGLFDVMSNEEIGYFARKATDLEKLVQALKREALVKRHATDSVTIVAVALQKERRKSSRSTQIARTITGHRLLSRITRRGRSGTGSQK